MSLLTVEQKIYCLADLLVLYLPVEVFVNYLCTLLGSDVGQKVCAQIARNGNIISRPRIAGGIYKAGIESELNMGLYLTARCGRRVYVVAV